VPRDQFPKLHIDPSTWLKGLGKQGLGEVVSTGVNLLFSGMELFTQTWLGVVAYTRNPSHLGGRDRRIKVLGQPWAKAGNSISKITKAKGAGGVA
jgi:hypothetical protein